VQNAILVVDPDPRSQLLLFRILAEAGYAVTAASDGAEAVAKIEADPPALVLANTHCPAKSGIELCHYAKARPEPLPVILIAPEPEPAPIEPADAVIGTPLDPGRTVEAVRRVLGADEAEVAAAQDTILIIDDDLGILDLLENVLAREGYAVVVADCGRDGIAALEREKPSLVLLDVQMPGMSGFEVLTKIRELGCDVPVIIVTAYGSEDVATDALRLGADDYVAKPLRVPHLCFRIQRNLEKARLRASRELLNKQLRQTTLELVDRLQGALEAGAAERGVLAGILDDLRAVLVRDGGTPAVVGLVERLRAAAAAEDVAASLAAVADAVRDAKGS
jgi:DNA-binding response OmpR family regulator